MTSHRCSSSARAFVQTDVALIASVDSCPDGVMAFSLRTGGWSGPPWDSLNFSAQVGDEPRHITRNLEVLGTNLGLDPNRIAFCRQVHGDSVAVLDTVPREQPSADAVISLRPGLFAGIKTADCLPILVLDPVRRISAAIHAGWKGTLLRITRKVLRLLLEDQGAKVDDLIVALGPAIGPCCYEVDEAVLVPFMKSFPDPGRFISDPAQPAGPAFPGPQRKRLDLARANLQEILAAGVPRKNVFSTGLCTSCDKDLFFSYRRDRGRTGRHAAVVGFR